MAFRLLHAGKHKDTYRAEKGWRPTLLCTVNGEEVVVTRDEVKGYVENPEFLQALDLWHKTKLWGMPNGSGWANEPQEVLDAITALELESKAIEAEEIERAKNESRRGKN